MKTSSCKAKGRRLSQLVKDRILESFPVLQSDDIIVQSSGVTGEDLVLSPKAREMVPFSIECKNQEKVNVWQSFEQCTENAMRGEPLLIIARNRTKPLAILDLDCLMECLSLLQDMYKNGNEAESKCALE
jgi:hypothetical protein